MSVTKSEKMPNPTAHPDARPATCLLLGDLSRAGGCERWASNEMIGE